MSRFLHQRIDTARRRSNSSARWLQRKVNDPYTQKAKQYGYRSRAAWKLCELDDKFEFIRPARSIIEFGAAPGGWLQVLRERAHAQATVLGVDRLPIDSIEGVQTLQCDIFAEDFPAQLDEFLPLGTDLILSDLAPNSIGHATTDHLRIMVLLEAMLEVALPLLAEGGSLVTKVFSGSEDQELVRTLRQQFGTVKQFKPKATHKASREKYIVAQDRRVTVS